MPETKRRLPIGVQSFQKLREEQFVYVDKTRYIYQLAEESVQYFLSRPRRFGKSLFLSALRAYWEGKKELFVGLEIEKLERDNPDAWQPHPVFYFDFNGQNYQDTPVEAVIIDHLKRWEEQYQVIPDSETLGGRFQKLLIAATKQTGQRCVVLVDEYDKPLLELIGKPERQEHNKAVFKGFFSNLKSCDEYIQFVFITGVTKFYKVSIFSDLNQLRDISLNEKYAGICGITDSELREAFAPEVAAMAEKCRISNEECLQKLKAQYDGYRFHPNGDAVYNPFSLINALCDKEFGFYWFETGTPTFLIKQLKKIGFEPRRFSDKTIYTNERTLKEYTGDSLDIIPLLYQTGYLTVDSYDAARKRYSLAFPNEEVKYAFLESFIPEYVPAATAGNGLDIFTLDEDIENGNLDGVKQILTALFASIPYTSSDAPFEHYFQTVIYLVFTLLGRYVLCEMHTFSGRIDCKVETDNYIYLFEFKRDESADAALKQIEDKSYTLPFIADSRKLYKIGVSFDSEKRILADWKVRE